MVFLALDAPQHLPAKRGESGCEGALDALVGRAAIGPAIAKRLPARDSLAVSRSSGARQDRRSCRGSDD
jgi:hypothetical protein